MPGTFEMIVAMNVIDEDRYTQYRHAMTPILQSYGGWFRYDLKVAQILRSPAAHPITRVFSICFPTKDAKEEFFADPGYQAAKAPHFSASVDGFSIIAELVHAAELTAF